MTTKRHLAKPDCALLAEESDSSCSEDGSHEVQGQGGITFRRRRIDPTELTPKQLDRVMKNRQAAQASRDRKRAYVTELEASRDRLEEEARELRVRVRDLEQEKDQLADEVCQLRGDFEELKKMMLCQLDPKEQAGLLDRLRAPRAGVVPCGGMVSSRMTDSLAMNCVLQAAASPSVKDSDHPHLGCRLLTLLPLSIRAHPPQAPLASPKFGLEGLPSNGRILPTPPPVPGSLTALKNVRSRPSKRSSLWTMPPTGATWTPPSIAAPTSLVSL